MSRQLFASFFLAAVAGVAAAFPPRTALQSPTPAQPPMALPADRYELVVLAPHRPIRVAVKLDYDGKSLAERWIAALKTTFAAFDRDRSGDLNATEVKRMFSDTSAAALLQNGFFSPFPNDVPTVAWLDADGNGRVSFAEFAGYYRQAAAAAAQAFPPQPENPQSAAATEELFKLLDRNKDGKLSRAEVGEAEKWVAARDTDEDECLSLNEVVGTATAGFAAPVPVVGGRAAPRPVGPVAVFAPGRAPDHIRDLLRTQYDAGKTGGFTRAAFGLDKVAFAALDANGDGTLSPGEAERWWTGPVDVEVTMSFAAKAADCRVAVTTDPATLAARGFAVSQAEPRRLVLRQGRQPIEFAAASMQAAGRQAVLRQQFLFLFDRAAGGKKHVVDADLGGQNAPVYQQLRVLFDAADADADGKLTRTELEAHIAIVEAFSAGALALTPTVQMPTLFQLLDDNRDGRLTVRELRTAWDRLAVLEPAGEGGRVEAITKAAIQPTAHLRLSRPAERFIVAQVATPTTTPTAPTAGPLWFRKMDRNADGDLSRAEFLGTRAEFDALDTDRDGLISAREAETYDAAARKR